jgi:glycosyltransferase involved in cell wall biosynthesis
MRILQLCSKIPYPAKDGGCLAMLNMAEMMYLQGIEVKILAMETHKHLVPENGYPAEFKQKFTPESSFINTKVAPINALNNLLFSKKSYHLDRFTDKGYDQKLLTILYQFCPDVIVLDSLFTCGYIDTIKLHSKAKIVYRAHNIEHLIWKEIAAKTKSLFKKYYLLVQSRRLKNEELKAISNCDGIVAITNKDAAFFKQHFFTIPILTLPFTLDIARYSCENNFHNKSLFFIGAMDWYPNLEGIKWFIDKVWDDILKQHPEAKLYLAGKSMPADLKSLAHKNIINLGEVSDAREFMKNAPIMIAPIFSGGGLKIKIVEAMAMGKIVICNSQAAFGIAAAHHKNIMLANSSAEFIVLINEIFRNPNQYSYVGENARLLIEKDFNAETKGKELALFLKSFN